MRRFLVYDTETSGFPSKKIAANDPKQAWICQFGAMLVDEMGNELITVNVLQHSNGRDMNVHAQRVHGIATSTCDEQGLSTLELADLINALFQQCDIAVCHNADFDKSMLVMLAESLGKAGLTLGDQIKATPHFDTMKPLTDYVGAVNKWNKPKWPKLEELYAKLFDGAEFENAHDAFADVKATLRCFMHPDVQRILNEKFAPVRHMLEED